jgi:hypothetical protein
MTCGWLSSGHGCGQLQYLLEDGSGPRQALDLHHCLHLALPYRILNQSSQVSHFPPVVLDYHWPKVLQEDPEVHTELLTGEYPLEEVDVHGLLRRLLPV